MAVQEHVGVDRIREIVETAAHHNAPIVLSCRQDSTWRNYPSRFLGLRDGRVWVECAVLGSGQDPPQLRVGQKIGVAFKQRHYKHAYCTDITAITDFQVGSAGRIRGLCISWPTKMHRFQRRIFQRVEVPASLRLFVHFWEGGLGREPPDLLRDRLTYCGQLVDLSGGGFRTRLLSAVDPGFRCGDSLGAALIVDGQTPGIKVDAQFRHAETDEYGVMLGVQMMGMIETEQGRDALGQIVRIMQKCQFSYARHLTRRAAG